MKSLARLACLLALLLSTLHAAAQDEGPSVELPDSAPGRHMAWVLKVINGQDLGDPREHFSDHFLEMTGDAKVREMITSLRDKWWQGGDARPIRVDTANDSSIAVILNSEKVDHPLSAFLALDDKTGKIAGLTFTPAFGFGAGRQGNAADWDDMKGDMGKLNGGVSFGCYEIAQDPTKPGATRLAPIHEFGEDTPRDIAGGVRLLVLTAVADAADAGTIRWDGMVPIREKYKSAPPGRLAEAAVDAEFSAADLALRMMRESDNTATDHLIGLLGRDGAEKALTALARDKRNIPLLTTREFYSLKLAEDQETLREYAGCDETDRRDMLDNDVSLMKPALMQAADWKNPREIDKVGWYASARELCHAWEVLHALEGKEHAEPLAAAMNAGVGLTLDQQTWPLVRFAGGAEPGAQTLTMLMKRSDDRWFTIAAVWNNADKPLEQERLVDLLKSGVKILEAWEKPKEEK